MLLLLLLPESAVHSESRSVFYTALRSLLPQIANEQDASASLQWPFHWNVYSKLLQLREEDSAPLVLLVSKSISMPMLINSPFPEPVEVSAIRVQSADSAENSTTIVLSEKWTLPSSAISSLDCFVPASILHSLPSIEICLSSPQTSRWVRLSPSFLTLAMHTPDLMFWKLSQIQIRPSQVVSCLSCPLQEKVLAGQIAVLEFPLSVRHREGLESIEVEVANEELQKVLSVEQSADSLRVSLDLRASSWLSSDNQTFPLEFTLKYANHEPFHASCPLTISSPFRVSTKVSTFPHFALSDAAPAFQPEQSIQAVLGSLELPNPSCPFPSPSSFHSKTHRTSSQQVIAGFWFDLDVRMHNSVPLSVHSIRLQHPQNAFSRCLLINPIVASPLTLKPEASTIWHFSLAVSNEWIDHEIQGGTVEIEYSLGDSSGENAGKAVEIQRFSMKLPDLYVLHPPLSLRFECESTWTRGVPQTITAVIKNHCVDMIEINTSCHRSSCKWLIGSMVSTSRCVLIDMKNRIVVASLRGNQRNDKSGSHSGRKLRFHVFLAEWREVWLGSAVLLRRATHLRSRQQLRFVDCFFTNTTKKLFIKIRVERLQTVAASHQHRFVGSTHVQKGGDRVFGRHFLQHADGQINAGGGDRFGRVLDRSRGVNARGEEGKARHTSRWQNSRRTEPHRLLQN